MSDMVLMSNTRFSVIAVVVEEFAKEAFLNCDVG